MSRAVFIGGFGNGKANAERVAGGLEKYYEDVDPFTFSYAMQHPWVIRRASKGADLHTHSAGLMAAEYALPESVTAHSAPVPTSRLSLVGKTILKTVRMHTPGIGMHQLGDVAAVAAYDASSTAELATHPLGNLGKLGKIARFDAVSAAISMRPDVPATLVYTNGDEYFHLSDEREAVARAAGVEVLRLAGVHDELVLRPDEVLERTFALTR